METQATARPCAERIYNDPRWVGGEPCQLPVQVLESGKWWCGTHRESAKARRRAKSDSLYERQRAMEWARVDSAHEIRRRADHYDALVEALEAGICDCPKENCYLHNEEFRAAVDAVPGESKRQAWLKQARAALDSARLSDMSENNSADSS